MWGQGTQGQLGNGELQNNDAPQLIDDISLANCKMVQLGFCHSAALGYEDHVQPILMMFLYVRIHILFFFDILSFHELP